MAASSRTVRPRSCARAPVTRARGGAHASSAGRREALLAGLAAAGGAGASLRLPLPASAGEGGWSTAANGISWRDVAVGDGGAAYDGDVIRVVYTAHLWESEDSSKLPWKDTFDPFVLGGGGSSVAKGFKLALGGFNGDILPAWNTGIVGSEELGVPPMREGGTRIIRLPSELAYGGDGHHCKRGDAQSCEVPPGASVEIETKFLGFV